MDPYIPFLLIGVLGFGAVLHFAFFVLELLPWNRPFILGKVLKSKGIEMTEPQLGLTAMIVRNASIYNAILATGFLWATIAQSIGSPSSPHDLLVLRCFVLSGAVVAGLFGVSLSPATLVQAAVGGLGLVLVYLSR